MTNEPIWLTIARQYEGLREIPGARTAPAISEWLRRVKAWWDNDEVPWCGVACGGWFDKAGIDPPKAAYRAKAWLDWGVWLPTPHVGCVVVFSRAGGGHVGLVTGIDRHGNLLVFGGNQGDAVNERAFPVGRAIGYRWPAGYPRPTPAQRLELGSAPATTGEA